MTVIVRISHIRKADLCSNGARRWFKSYGFSWTDFLANGKSAVELEETGDPLALKVVAIAREEFEDGR